MLCELSRRKNAMNESDMLQWLEELVEIPPEETPH